MPFKKGHKFGKRFSKGHISWNKGKRFFQITGEKHYNWQGGKPKCNICGKSLSSYRAKRCGSCAMKIVHKNMPLPKNAITNSALKRKGKPSPRRGIKRPEMSGEKCHLWKGGITPINEKIRKSVEYKLWRRSVFERDNYICIWCKKRGGKLNADHIKPFCDYPELRFAIDNGRTLCEDCHKKTNTYLNRWTRK